MLDEGVATALRFYGQNLQTVCRVEWELSAASQLVALMEKQLIDLAPIWSDVTTFDAKAWRGKVDCIVAGFPCQDLSVAGARAGLDGKKSGLFYEVLRVAADSGAQWLFLENVAGITSATASVVDKKNATEYVKNNKQKGFSAVGIENGRLDERAVARVVGELADAGWDAEWLHLRADEVGAAHRRERWFCFAWRAMPNNESKRGRIGCGDKQPQQDKIKNSGAKLADTGLQHVNVQQRHDGTEPQGASRKLGNDQIVGLEGWSVGSKLDAQGRSDQVGSIAKSSDALFAPSPASSEWVRIIAKRPDLAPAIEPDFCSVVDGVACNVDASRAVRLRATGNGVVPLQAGCAYAELIKRSII